MNIDLECLKKLAKNATPGPWAAGKKATRMFGRKHPDSNRVYMTIKSGVPACPHIEVFVSGHDEQEWVEARMDADYLAVVSPDVVLEMIAEIERLKGLCKWDVGVLQALGILPKDTRDEDMTPDLRDAAMQKLHDMEFKKLKRLEDEADWLAGRLSCVCRNWSFCPAEELVDLVCAAQQCSSLKPDVWRGAARKAVEAQNDRS